MSAKTKILVFHMKEVIYTAIFLVLGLVFLLLLVFMFSSDKNKTSAKAEVPSRYTAGIYTASLTLGSSPVELSVTVDKDYISSIQFHQLDEAVAAMYPLMEPALESLSEQIVGSQSMEDISYSEESQYTSMMLMDAIQTAISKAEN